MSPYSFQIDQSSVIVDEEIERDDGEGVRGRSSRRWHRRRLLVWLVVTTRSLTPCSHLLAVNQSFVADGFNGGPGPARLVQMFVPPLVVYPSGPFGRKKDAGGRRAVAEERNVFRDCT